MLYRNQRAVFTPISNRQIYIRVDDNMLKIKVKYRLHILSLSIVRLSKSPFLDPTNDE